MKKATVIFLLVLFGVLGVVGGMSSFNNVNTFQGTVTDKVVKIDSTTKHPTSKYLVFLDTDNGVRVVEVADDTLMGRYDSSNLYGSIKIGHKYDMKVRGFRIPLFSSYENIDTVKEIK